MADITALDALIANGEEFVQELRSHASIGTPLVSHWKEVTRWHEDALAQTRSVAPAIADLIVPLSASNSAEEVEIALRSALRALKIIVGYAREKSKAESVDADKPGPVLRAARTRSGFVFVSYSRQDAAFVLKLAFDLQKAGVNLWIDTHDLRVGERWDDALEDALKRCGTLLVILSPNAVESPNVKDEISYAFDEGKRLLPVLYAECKVPLRLRRLQHIDFTSTYQSGYANLVAALKNDELESSSPDITPQG